MNYNKQSILTKEQAIAIQTEHLSRWEKILKPEVFSKLKSIVTSRNEVEKHADSICRGNNIDMLLMNWPPCQSIINVCLHNF